MFYAAFDETGSLVGLYEGTVPQNVRLGADEIVAIGGLADLKAELAKRGGNEASIEANLEALSVDLFDGLSEALDRCFKVLDEKGLSPEKAGATLKEKGKKIATEVRSLGIKSMNGLRDRLRDFADIIDEAVKPPQDGERPLPTGGDGNDEDE